jgi:hypothetical protein
MIQMADQNPTTASTTGATSAPKRSTTARKAAPARKRAAATRKPSAAARKAAETPKTPVAPKTPVDLAQAYAERAVLIPVGAAFTARDKAVATFEDLAASFSTREKAEKELAARRKRLEADLKRFERRGRTERNRVERQVKKTRTRVERELRQRRNRVEREIRSTGKDVGAQANVLGTRAQSLVQTGIDRGTQVAAKVQERLADVA